MGFMSVLALHSTMSLLKPGGSRHSDESEENFTFHYVSIKTGENYAELEHTYFFTFHYVSIKTYLRLYVWTVKSKLYIPLCLY